MAYPRLTASQAKTFPYDGYPWQVENLGTKTVPSDHYGQGGETYDEWVAIYQNYRNPAHREIIYRGYSCQEVLDWIHNP